MISRSVGYAFLLCIPFTVLLQCTNAMFKTAQAKPGRVYRRINPDVIARRQMTDDSNHVQDIQSADIRPNDNQHAIRRIPQSVNNQDISATIDDLGELFVGGDRTSALNPYAIGVYHTNLLTQGHNYAFDIQFDAGAANIQLFQPAGKPISKSHIGPNEVVTGLRVEHIDYSGQHNLHSHAHNHAPYIYRT